MSDDIETRIVGNTLRLRVYDFVFLLPEPPEPVLLPLAAIAEASLSPSLDQEESYADLPEHRPVADAGWTG